MSSGLQYGFAVGSGTLTLRGDWSYKSEVFHDVFNDPRLAQSAFDIVNAYASFVTGNDRWEIALFGTNLTDERYRVSGNSSAGFGLAESTFSPPRRVGSDVALSLLEFDDHRTAAHAWRPAPFLTDVERREDGTLLLRPRAALGEYPARLTDTLEYWASTAPDRVLIARRGADGVWIEMSYRDVLARVQRIAAGLHARRLSPERPILILSGNSIEHFMLGLAALWAGVPYCPMSPAYSQVSQDLGRLRYVMDQLTPGLVAAFDTPAFERALAAAPGDAEIVGDAQIRGRSVTMLSALEAAPSSALAEAHERVGPDSIARFLLTSGSTGQPKAVITTHRMICSNALVLRQALPFLVDEPPVLVDWLPWNHTFGGSHNIGLVLLNGGSLYIDDGKPVPATFGETLRNLREISPTVYFNVPKGFELLAHHLQEDAQLRRMFFARLRANFFAGASLAQHTWDALDAASLRERGKKTPMLSGLGATETGPSVTFTTPAMGRSGVIGLPAAGNLREARARGGQTGDTCSRARHDARLLARAAAHGGRLRRGRLLPNG